MTPKATTTLQPLGLDSRLAEEMATLGLSEIVMKVGDRSDMNVECITSGLPRLDKAIHPTKLGIPVGRNVEIRSNQPEVGKTTLGLDIIKAWQKEGKSSAIVDVENTIDEAYILQQGIEIDPDNDKGYYVPYVVKPYDSKGNALSAEKLLEVIEKMSSIFDIVLVDSLPALAKTSDLEKDAGDPSQMGGIGKIMFDHCRRNLNMKATVIWLNQLRQKIGGYNPTGNIMYKPAGGDALQFFGTLQIELRLVEKLSKGTEKDAEVYGVKVEAYIAKNKIAPPYRRVTLTYLNGEGFSTAWDMYEAAKAAGIVVKTGSWYKFGDIKLQGDLEFYNNIKKDPEVLNALQLALDAKAENDAKG